MLKIGLTGGIGSGKSIVAAIFSVLGIPVFDADTAAKKLMNEDEELKQKLIKTFGEKTYSTGILNRKFLADKVFNDASQLEILNSIVHPEAIKAAETWMQKQTTAYVIKEAALLFESGSGTGLDYIIGVSAPQHLRILRVMKRESAQRKEVLARINRQIDEDIKMTLCDFIILNDEQQLLIPQIITLHEKFLLLNNQFNKKNKSFRKI